MNRATRSQADRRNRDAEVMEAAITLFNRKGYASCSLQDVADVVGVLKGSLYHYISSKEELLFRILQESHEQARDLMVEVSALDAAPIERLWVYLERTYLWYLQHPQRVNVYLHQQHHLTGQRQVEMRIRMREFDAFLRELLAEAKGAGALRPDLDVKLAAFFILGALNAVPSWYQPDGPYSAELIAGQFASMSLRMLAEDPPVPEPAVRCSG